MSDVGTMLPQPPFVEGGAWRFDPTCWSAAMSSWQAVTQNRRQDTKDELEARMVKADAVTLTKNGKVTLDAGKFDLLAKDDNVRLAWRPIKGHELFGVWNLELFLETSGYLYMIERLGVSEHAGGMMSHALVLFGAWDAFKTAYFMDPGAGRTVVDYQQLRQRRFLVGVAQERLPSYMSDGWINEKPG